MDVRLEVLHEQARHREVSLYRDTLIGRGRDCQLRIPVEEVSRQHCRLSFDGERLLLRDLSSSNGTTLEGKRIPADRDLLVSDGDTITVGPVSFVVHLNTSQTTSPQSPTNIPPVSLEDTAEFNVIPELETDNTNLVADENDPASPADAASPSPPPAEIQRDVPLVDEAGPDDEGDSIVDLQLSASPDHETEPPDSSADEPEDPIATDGEDAADVAEAPHKSRSLFGLFRRGQPSADEDDTIDEDELIEEVGEDPPAEDLSPDPEVLSSSEESSDDHAAGQDDDDHDSFEFHQTSDETDDNDPVDDDNLSDFLGQFSE
ncbi:MAG: FHA domain-containing protein [Planctomycetaceae bacterium]|jgi:pSer/pThr/pTyr-binding forkhead associated (FHA) protein|nr:FHA domain-containing protein [Planctomycetaceae bacterium]